MNDTQRTVSDVMRQTVVAVGRTALYKEIAKTLAEWKVSAVPVLEGEGRVIGVVSEADLLAKEEFKDRDPSRVEQLRRIDDLAKAGAGTAELLRGLHDRGLAVAAVSPTARARRLLDTGQLVSSVDVVLDGDDRNRLHLPPRPDPALLLRAVRMLGARPEETAAVDASPSGVAAARQGGFGRIVGLAAPGDLDSLTSLFHQGADYVVHELGELHGAARPMPTAA